MNSAGGGPWCPLGESDLADVGDLGRRVLAVDGGLPLVGEEAFVSGRYVGAGTRAIGVRADDGRLVAAVGVRLVRAAGSGAAGSGRAGESSRAVATAMVDPGWRGRGLGGQALDWALAVGAEIGSGPVTVETESLTAAAGALFESRGLRQVFAEDVMRFDLGGPVPVVGMPVGVTLASWTPELAGRFFAVYEAAFRDRAGFPGWPAERWIEWISGDEDFRPEWTLLATESSGRTGVWGGTQFGGEDVGFVACATGWIVQVGVRPDQRGRRLGAALVTEALRRMRDDGLSEALLDVNVDNPAGRLYERLGFTVVGRRARFRQAS